MAHKNLSKDNEKKSEPENNKRSKANDNVSLASISSDSLPTPPDGGYGWVVVFAAFISNMITDGTAFSFGVLYDDLLDYFNESESKTSFVGSIFMGVPLLASPIASALINKYGCRAVSIAGGLVATFGFVLSYFANSIEFLCLSFGLVSGVGLAMVYTPAVVIVAFYFEKKRALATGLSVAGSGIGTLAFAPLVEILTAKYGWRGTILILSGVMLNTCVCGALFRPLSAPEPPVRDDRKTITLPETKLLHHSPTGSDEIAKMRELYSDSYSHSLIQFPTYLTKTNSSSSKLKQDDELAASNNELTHPNSPSKHESQFIINGALNNRCLETPTITISSIHDNEDIRESSVSNGKLRTQTTISDGHQAKSSVSERLHPLYRRDIFYKGSLLWIPQQQQSTDQNSPKRVSSCPEMYIKDTISKNGDEEESNECCQWVHVKRVVKEMLDISIFCQPLYTIFFISNFLLYAWYDIPYFYLPNSASSTGLTDDQGSLIISVIGIGNTIGQVAFGLIADFPQVNNSLVYGIGMFLCGVSILFIPLCKSMLAMCIVGSLFGTFIGANYALCSIIIVDLLSLEKLTNAYGIILCGQGVANLVGPPLGGLLSDYTNSYEATYVTAGACIAISGLMMVAVFLYQYRKSSPRGANSKPETEVLDCLTLTAAV